MQALPPESALAYATNNWWTMREELSATTAELIHESYRVALARAGVKTNKLPPRLRIPRPSDPPKKTRIARRRPANAEEIKAMLAAAHRRK